MNKLQHPHCESCSTKSKSYFSKLAPEDIQELNQQKYCTIYKAGQIIFYEGRGPSGIYCLQQGKVKIFKNGINGKEQIVRFVLPGDLLGIRSLVGRKNYSASASAIEDSVICFIDARFFFNLIRKYPAIIQRIMMSLSQLLEEAENKLTSIAQKGVRERLAEVLLHLCQNVYNGHEESDEYFINISRTDLANIVGAATETVIRGLSEFKSQNLINITGRKIIIRNKEALEKIINYL